MNTAAGSFSPEIRGEGKDERKPNEKSNFLSEYELEFHIRACALNDRI